MDEWVSHGRCPGCAGEWVHLMRKIVQKKRAENRHTVVVNNAQVHTKNGWWKKKIPDFVQFDRNLFFTFFLLSFTVGAWKGPVNTRQLLARQNFFMNNWCIRPTENTIERITVSNSHLTFIIVHKLKNINITIERDLKRSPFCRSIHIWFHCNFYLFICWMTVYASNGGGKKRHRRPPLWIFSRVFLSLSGTFERIPHFCLYISRTQPTVFHQRP